VETKKGKGRKGKVKEFCTDKSFDVILKLRNFGIIFNEKDYPAVFLIHIL